MGYERIQKPEGLLYHYTRKENLESILRDGRIRKFCDRETWFTKSLADTLQLMSLTVMQEGELIMMRVAGCSFTRRLYRRIMWF